MIQTLKNSKIPDTDIQQISGHANIQSLNNYNEMNMEAQEEVSNILAGYSSHLRKEVSVNFCRKGEVVSSDVVPKSPKIPVKCHSEFSPTIRNLADVSVLDILADKSNLPNEKSNSVGITSNLQSHNLSKQPTQMFPNATISGGTFNTIIYHCSPSRAKRRRVAVIGSDSESE